MRFPALAKLFNLDLSHSEFREILSCHFVQIRLTSSEPSDRTAVHTGDEFGLRRIELRTVDQRQVVPFVDSDACVVGVHFFESTIDVCRDGRQFAFVVIDRTDRANHTVQTA